jgi:arylsulfatase A-like enzyme
VDLFPTLLDLAGVDDPRAHQGPGATLRPLFTGTGEDRPGYSEAVGVKIGAENWLVSVRDGGFKLVKRAAGEGLWLWKLPQEHVDVAEMFPEEVARLEGVLADLLSGAPLERTGEELSAGESAEVEAHLRDLGYID